MSLPWSPFHRRAGVAGFLGPVWPPWGRGWSPKPRLAVVGAWLVPWAPSGSLGGVARPLHSVWMPWGVAGPLGPVSLPCGRGRSPGPCLVAVKAWPVPWAPSGRRGSLAGPVGPVWQRGGVAGPLSSIWPPWWRSWSPGFNLPDVEALPVSWAFSGSRAGVAGLLGSIWPP